MYGILQATTTAYVWVSRKSSLKKIRTSDTRVSYWLNLKNCCVPKMGLVSVFSPLTTTGAGRLVVQTGETRFVVGCRIVGDFQPHFTESEVGRNDSDISSTVDR